jgi:hypothetical protein
VVAGSELGIELERVVGFDELGFEELGKELGSRELGSSELVITVVDGAAPLLLLRDFFFFS